MKNHDTLNVSDNVTITLRDAVTGSITHQSTHNLVTHPGEMFVVDRMRERASVTPMDLTTTYVALGTGSTIANYWLGSLITEISGVGNPGRDVPDSLSRSTQTVLVSNLFTSTQASGGLTEAGIFITGYDSGGNLQTVSAALDSGGLFAYATFNEITKDDTNTLTLDWELLF